MLFLKQSTAVDVMLGPFVDYTAGNATEEAMTITQAELQLCKNGGTAAQKNDATSATHRYGGNYMVDLNATDTDTVGHLRLMCKDGDALPVIADFTVLEEAVYDALFAASATGFDSNGRVDVGSWLGTAVTTSSTSSKPEVDVNSISDDATAANNAESFFDGTGYAGTGNTIPTVTDITNGVNATSISGSSATADNLETLFDGNEGFYAAYQGPRGPGVYYNDGAANTNTTNGVDGTIGNPVSTIGAAKTIADSMSLDRIYFVNNSSATLAASMNDYEFVGIGEMGGNSITLGTQSIDNSMFINLTITGAQAGTGTAELRECSITSMTGADIIARNCAIESNITFARDSFLHHCYSAVAGNGTPQFNCNSVANLDLCIRNYSGGVEFTNAVSTTTASLEGNGQFIINANCTSMSLSVRGMFKETDNGTTSSITKDDNSDTLENIAPSSLAITPGTAITGTLSTTQFTTDLTEATDDHYNGRVVIFTSGDLAGEAREITDYTGATKLITVAAMTDTPANTDAFVIV